MSEPNSQMSETNGEWLLFSCPFSASKIKYKSEINGYNLNMCVASKEKKEQTVSW